MLLAQAPDALRADFRRLYSVSLTQLIDDDVFEAADLAAHLPKTGESATFRALNPDSWRWGVQEHLAAIQADHLRLLAWMKTKDASKKRPKHRPDPIPRPGIAEKQREVEGRFKDLAPASSLEELKRKLAMPRSAA